MTQKHVGLIGRGRWGRFIARNLKTLGCRVSVADCSAVGRNNAEQAGADAIPDAPLA